MLGSRGALGERALELLYVERQVEIEFDGPGEVLDLHILLADNLRSPHGVTCLGGHTLPESL